MKAITLTNVSTKIQNFPASVIIAIRNLSGYTLVESKEFLDRYLLQPGSTKTIDVGDGVSTATITNAIRDLVENDIAINVVENTSNARKNLFKEIEQLITFATTAGEYDIAKSLLSVLDLYNHKITHYDVKEL